MNRVVVIVIIVAVLAIGGFGVYWSLQPNGNALALAGVVESQEVRLGSKIGGRVDEVAVVDAVAQRELETARADLGRAAGRQRAAKAKHEMLSAGSRAEDIAEARAEVARLEGQYYLLFNGSRKEDIDAAAAALAEANAKL